MHADSTTAEEWRPVVGFGGAYEVSSLGRVRSVDRWIDLSDGRRRRAFGRVLKPGFSGQRRSYFKVALGLGCGRTRAVHLLVCEAWHGQCRPGAWCRHLNGDSFDNRQENLAWGTPGENAADMVRHGMSTRGEKNPMAKLTAEDVREIRSLRDGGMMLKDIGARFGIGESAVCRIAQRVRWGHDG